MLCAVPRAPARYNPLRPDGLDRATPAPARAPRRLRGQGVVDPDSPPHVAACRVAAGAGAAPPADALHPILRLRDIRWRTRRRPIPPIRVSASLDLGVQREVDRRCRGPSWRWRASARSRPRRSWCSAGRTPCWRRSAPTATASARRSDRFHPRHPLAGQHVEAVPLRAALQRGLLHRRRCLTTSPGGRASATPTAAFSARCRRARRWPIRATCRRWTCCAAGSASRPAFTLWGCPHDLDRPATAFGPAMAIGALPTTLDRLVAPTPRWPMTACNAIAWFRAAARRRRAAGVLRRPARLVDIVPRRSDGPAAELSALRQHEYPFAVAVEDRHLAGLSRCLDGRLVAGLPGRRLGRTERRRRHDAIERRKFGRAARARDHAAAA